VVDALVRAVRGMLVVASVVILGSCSANPTESPEYQALEAELVQAQSTASQLSEDLTLAQDDLARLGSELEDALARGEVLEAQGDELTSAVESFGVDSSGIKHNIEMWVWINDDVDPDRIGGLTIEIGRMDGVTEIEYLTRDEVFQEVRGRLAESPEALEQLSENVADYPRGFQVIAWTWPDALRLRMLAGELPGVDSAVLVQLR
jgi:hypothetical protein